MERKDAERHHADRYWKWALAAAVCGLAVGFGLTDARNLVTDLFALRADELRRSGAQLQVQQRAINATLEAGSRDPGLRLALAQIRWPAELREGGPLTTQALQRAPSRGEAWLVRAWIEVARDPTGPALLQSVRQVNRLAPAVRPIQLSLAMMGIQYWTLAEAAVRKEWQSAIDFSLLRQRPALLAEAERRGVMLALCLGFVERYDQEPGCRQSMGGEP